MFSRVKKDIREREEECQKSSTTWALKIQAMRINVCLSCCVSVRGYNEHYVAAISN